MEEMFKVSFPQDLIGKRVLETGRLRALGIPNTLYTESVWHYLLPNQIDG